MRGSNRVTHGADSVEGIAQVSGIYELDPIRSSFKFHKYHSSLFKYDTDRITERKALVVLGLVTYGCSLKINFSI